MCIRDRDKELNTPIVFSFTPSDKIDDSAWLRKNLGFSVLSVIYHELEIHKFMANRQRSLKTDFSLNDVFKMLVFLRILEPGSKKKSFERKDAYFESNLSRHRKHCLYPGRISC